MRLKNNKKGIMQLLVSLLIIFIVVVVIILAIRFGRRINITGLGG